MSFSLNEVEATAKRAARGAGYAWGVAEEAAKATRWLCAQGIDGAAELTRLLEHGFAGSVGAHVPTDLRGEWTGAGVLCPLMTGALLSDRSDLLQSGSIRIRQLASPLLLMPFAAHAARSRKAIVSVSAGDFLAATDGAQLLMKNQCPARVDLIEVALGGCLTAPLARKTRAVPDPSAWKTLNRFAHRTYAPATEESRLLGAGAGLSDND
ncbi:hypothetical protein RA27_08925 [Ruegeria sp. ANG-R]|uniref:DUF3726 domain-containing protein n=1 Tax=Ruegeria sp. ANG-R TaxID=1577903 RepID=UPI00057E5661|nr:DUF3726 domain-containing protein [Ruegeria sp. ANG-R]KIC41387.1 hypothetical protein RA27_08925 [Ruegeria sp. ANG-R]